MSAQFPAERAVEDARALLDTLLASAWTELHVASGGTEIFVAMAGGRENPMRAAAEPAVTVSAAEPAIVVEVPAPHVATLVSVEAEGASVAAGARVATLRVLDEEKELLAPVAGRVVRGLAKPGDLVEVGQPVVALEKV